MRARARAVGALLALISVIGACGGDPAPKRLGALLRAGQVLVVGEIHGTKEIPAAVTDAIEDATERNLSVHLGLEIPSDETEAFARYIKSAGNDRDRGALLRSAFWGTTDGRSSRAMLDLIDDVRALRADGRSIELMLFDVPRDFRMEKDEPDGRDAVMSLFISDTVDEHPDDAFIVLVGSFHAGRAVASVEGKEFEPMVRWLAEQAPYVTTLRATHAGGTAWTCTGDPIDCGTHPQQATGSSEERPPSILLKNTDAGFDGRLFVGKITASRPARSKS